MTRWTLTPVGWAALGLLAVAIVVAAVASAAVGLLAIVVVAVAVGAAVVSGSERLALVRGPRYLDGLAGAEEAGLPSQVAYNKEGATFRDRMYPR